MAIVGTAEVTVIANTAAFRAGIAALGANGALQNSAKATGQKLGGTIAAGAAEGQTKGARAAAGGVASATEKEFQKVGARQGRAQLQAYSTSLSGRGFGDVVRANARQVGALAVLAGAVAAPAAVIGQYERFNTALTESTAIMDVTAKQTEDLSKVARTAAKDLGLPAEEAAESYFFLASAGLDAEQSIKALPQVLQFATAGNFDAATATDLLTDAQSALGRTLKDPVKNLEEMTSLSNQLVKANQLANATVEQFSVALTNKAGKALVNTNKSTEEGLAVLSLFADQGIKASRAGNLLNIGLRDLPRAIAKNRDEFKKFGFELEDSDKNLVNLADVSEQFTRVFAGLGTTERASLLDQLGLTRGSGDFIKALIGGADAIREYEDRIANAGNTTEIVANKQLQSLSARFRLLKSQIGDLSISFGEGFQDAAKNLLDGLTGGIGGEGAGDAARSLGEAAARGLAAAIDIGKQLVAILKQVANAISVVSGAISALNSFTGGAIGNLTKQFLGLYASLRLIQALTATGAALLPLSILGGRKGGGGGTASRIAQTAAATTVLAGAQSKLNRAYGTSINATRASKGSVPGLPTPRAAKNATNAVTALNAATIAAAGRNLKLGASAKAASTGFGQMAKSVGGLATGITGFALLANPMFIALAGIPLLAIGAGLGIAKLVNSIKGVDPNPVEEFTDSLEGIEQKVLDSQAATQQLRDTIGTLERAEGVGEFRKGIQRLGPALREADSASRELNKSVDKSNESLEESARAVGAISNLPANVRALSGSSASELFNSENATEFLGNVSRARAAQDELTTSSLKNFLQLRSARDAARKNGASDLQVSRLRLQAVKARTTAIGELSDAQNSAFSRIRSVQSLVGVGDSEEQRRTLVQLKDEYQSLLRVSAQGEKIGLPGLAGAENIKREIANIEASLLRLQKLDVQESFLSGDVSGGLLKASQLISNQTIETQRLLGLARQYGVETKKGAGYVDDARAAAKARNVEAVSYLQTAKAQINLLQQQRATAPQGSNQQASLDNQIAFIRAYGEQIVNSLQLPPDAAQRLLSSLTTGAGQGLELPVKLKPDTTQPGIGVLLPGAGRGQALPVTVKPVTPTGAPVTGVNSLLGPGGAAGAAATGAALNVPLQPVNPQGAPITGINALFPGGLPGSAAAPGAPLLKVPAQADFTAAAAAGTGAVDPNIPPVKVPGQVDFSAGALAAGGTVADQNIPPVEVEGKIKFDAASLDGEALKSSIQSSLGNISVTPKVKINVGSTGSSAGKKIATAIGTGLKGSAKPAAAAKSAVKKAITAGETAAAGASSIGAAIGAGIASGIEGAVGDIVAAAVSAVESAKTAAAAAADLGSPSRLFRDEIGIPISQGIAVGITAAVPQITRALTSGLQDVVKAGRAALGPLAGTFTQTLSQITTSVNQAIQSAKQNLSSISGTIGSEIGKVLTDRATEQSAGITNIVNILQKEIADLQLIDQNLSTANQRLAIEERISGEVADQASAKLKLQRLEASINGRSAADAAGIPAAVRRQEQLRLEELRKSANEQTKAQKELAEFDARQLRAADITERQNAIKTLNEESNRIREAAQKSAEAVATNLKDLATALNLGIISPGDYSAQLKDALERSGINFDNVAKRFGLTAAQQLLENISAASRQAGLIGGPNAPRGTGSGSQPRVISPLATFSRSVTLFRNDIVRELKTSRNTQKEQDKEIAEILKEGVSKDEKERLAEVRQERNNTTRQIGALKKIEKALKTNTPTELVQQNTFNVQGGDQAFRVLQQRLNRLESLATR